VTSSTIVIILIVIAVLVLGLIAFLIIRRQRYIRALRGRGWTFESRPSLESVLDHHAPPFGLGFVRKVDEAISGQTATGVPFRVFEYASANAVQYPLCARVSISDSQETQTEPA